VLGIHDDAPERLAEVAVDEVLESVSSLQRHSVSIEQMITGEEVEHTTRAHPSRWNRYNGRRGGGGFSI